MKKKILILLLAQLIYLVAAGDIFASGIIWQDIGRGNRHVKTVLTDPLSEKVIYIGTRNAVLKTEDGGESWRNILIIRGQNKSVNLLMFSPRDSNHIYAATGNGLFLSQNQGKNWSRIFQGKSSEENECTALAILANTIYLGTKKGLFISRDNSRSWSKEISKLGNSHILSLTYSPNDPNSIYLVCVDGVFRSLDNGETWERVYVANPTEDNDEDAEQVSEDTDEQNRSSFLRYLSTNRNKADSIYLATERGAYRSQDKGKTWDLIPSYGLLSEQLKFLIVSDNSDIYAVAKAEVFEYKKEGWRKLSFGLTAREINSLGLDNRGNLYAACDNGLFKASLQSSDNANNSQVVICSRNEPAINDIQQAAISYAEVAPEKIQRWRKQAAKKAYLPEVSVGIDRNITDLWHWESGSSTKTDDDTLRRGKDGIEWNVSLSWDLSELIWNQDQTSIDVRSRLMVQLRDDILDEVTKLYFERLRVKMELDNLSIIERKKRSEKELRVQELTASLDALTGGYFSQQLKSS
jgi:photosystem II stability/assembly factor-like uncharacterized protein